MKKLGVILLMCVCLVGFVGLGKALAASTYTLGGESTINTEGSIITPAPPIGGGMDPYWGDPYWWE